MLGIFVWGLAFILGFGFIRMYNADRQNNSQRLEIEASVVAKPEQPKTDKPQPQGWEGKVELAHGRIAPLSPIIDSFIVEFKVKLGDRVKKDQECIIMDVPNRLVVKRQNELAEARAALQKARAVIDRREKDHRRDQHLKAANTRVGMVVISDTAFDEGLCFRDTAEQEFHEAEMRVKIAEDCLFLQNWTNGYYTLRSPISGTVVSLTGKPGEVATPARTNVVWGEILDDSVVEIPFSILEKEALAMKVGDDVMIVSDQEKLKGKIIFVSPTLNDCQTVPVLAEADNKEGKLKINKKVRVTLP